MLRVAVRRPREFRVADRLGEDVRPREEPERFAEPEREEPDRFAEPERWEADRFAEPERWEADRFAEPEREGLDRFTEEPLLADRPPPSGPAGRRRPLEARA